MFIVDQTIFLRTFTRTPVGVSPEILALAHELSPKYLPQYVSLAPDRAAMPRECFSNVQSKVKRDGGEIIYGWAIWEWPRVFIEAEHHAVWSSGTEWFDVTPQEIGIHRVLFIADPARVFDSVTFKRIINVKRALHPTPFIQHWIDVNHKLQQYMEDSSDGPIMRMDRSKLKVLRDEVRYAHAGVLIWLAQNTGRNDPCFCNSGRKFKNCCTEFIYRRP